MGTSSKEKGHTIILITKEVSRTVFQVAVKLCLPSTLWGIKQLVQYTSHMYSHIVHAGRLRHIVQCLLTCPWTLTLVTEETSGIF